jgi:segregation and condensation protein A
MPFAVRLTAFEGPLDLLLQLVESAKLPITDVSLVEVTEPFLAHLEEHRATIPAEELADFLVIASKLVYLKSKALLPSLVDPALEEGPDLASQLRAYQAFAAAAKRFAEQIRLGVGCYSRSKAMTPPLDLQTSLPSSCTLESLQTLYLAVIKRLQPILRLPKVAIERVVTIEEKMSSLVQRVRSAMRVSFHRFLAESETRMEAVVSFLALLELLHRHEIRIEQPDLFTDIHISSHTV